MTDRILALLQADHRMWTRAELFQWSDVLQITGLLKRGMKASIIMEKESNLQVEGRDMRRLFEAEPLNEFVALLQKAVNCKRSNDKVSLHAARGDVVKWWFNRVVVRRRKAAEFPVAIATRHGLDVLMTTPKCYVGSIHSFKGAEADCVILYPDVSPAGWREWSSPGAGHNSVVRLFYVAMTRARETLVVCKPLGNAVPIGGMLNVG